MYSVARFVVRHKVGAVAVLALGVFFFTPDAKDEVQKPSNPWAAQSQAVQVASADEPGFLDKLQEEAVGYLDEAGINPVDKADETVNRFNDTAAAYERLNGK